MSAQITPSPTPLTVLQLLPALEEGGVEQSTVEMTAYSVKRGIRSLVASAGGKKVAAIAATGATHITLPLDRKAPWWIAWNAWKIAQIVRSEGVDLIHARSRGPAWAGWLACHLVGFTRVKYVTTFHGAYGFGGWWKKLYNSVMLKGPVVIANSQFIKQHITEVYGYPPEQIEVAARGVEEDVFNPSRFKAKDVAAVRRELEVPDGVPLLLMTGRLTRWKGQAVLLEALKQVQDLPWIVAFAGGGDDAYALELRKQGEWLGVDSRIRWLGRRDDVALLNMAADLAFTCSTRPEAFGRVAIEAMAMETPVIASALGGSLETVKDGKTGWLVPVGDVDALAVAIQDALGNLKRLPTMGVAGRAWVLANFTAERCCAAEWRAYERVLAGRD